ncbi:hypothetical protein ACEQ8H_001208 [Pleosporales sp. CAS-2024a]
MADTNHDDLKPAVRFKRRNIAHPKRVSTEEETPNTMETQVLDAATPSDIAPIVSTQAGEQQDSVPNLKEIIRNRKRPRDRQKDVARKAEMPSTGIVSNDTPREGHYTGRFVAQTGQVVGRDDKQMTKYVEARLAEQNFRQYGWPIPTHLHATVAEIAPDLKDDLVTIASLSRPQADAKSPVVIQQGVRLAAGMGRIEEVDIEPITNWADGKWKRLENGEFQQIATGKVRLGRDGKPRRPPKRRNSDDVRRDQMVDAVLSEAKLDYFDAEAYANLRASGSANNDEAVLAQFKADYYESIQEGRRRPRRAAPAGGTKGAKGPSKRGPKLGGSKSARAKMRLAEGQAAKTKR